MTKEEMKYRIEQAKNDTPSTSLFVWFVPLFLVFALLGEDRDAKAPEYACV